MKTALTILALLGGLSPAVAGGMAEPVMDQTIILSDTASSGGDEWVGIMMTVLVFGAAVAGR